MLQASWQFLAKVLVASHVECVHSSYAVVAVAAVAAGVFLCLHSVNEAWLIE